MTTAETADVVLHVSTAPADLERGVGTATTILRSEPTLRIAVIVNGAALNAVVGAENFESPDNVTAYACEVGLARRGTEITSVRPGIQTVGSAAVALTRAQLNGAAYIRI